MAWRWSVRIAGSTNRQPPPPGAMEMTFRLGIDIGGTFTDGALVDEATGAIGIVKVLTTPRSPADGFMQTVRRALAEAGADAGALTLLVHATTIATNALIEGNIARVGLLATEGF